MILLAKYVYIAHKHLDNRRRYILTTHPQGKSITVEAQMAPGVSVQSTLPSLSRKGTALVSDRWEAIHIHLGSLRQDNHWHSNFQSVVLLMGDQESKPLTLLPLLRAWDNLQKDLCWLIHLEHSTTNTQPPMHLHRLYWLSRSLKLLWYSYCSNQCHKSWIYRGNKDVQYVCSAGSLQLFVAFTGKTIKTGHDKSLVKNRINWCIVWHSLALTLPADSPPLSLWLEVRGLRPPIDWPWARLGESTLVSSRTWVFTLQKMAIWIKSRISNHGILGVSKVPTNQTYVVLHVTTLKPKNKL